MMIVNRIFVGTEGLTDIHRHYIYFSSCKQAAYHILLPRSHTAARTRHSRGSRNVTHVIISIIHLARLLPAVFLFHHVDATEEE